MDKPAEEHRLPTAAPSLIGDILRRSGLSQAELARRAAMPRSVINAYLHGHRRPGVEALLRIATAAGLNLRLVRRTAPVDAETAGRRLVQVLELAEALPYRMSRELEFQRLPKVASS